MILKPCVLTTVSIFMREITITRTTTPVSRDIKAHTRARSVVSPLNTVPATSMSAPSEAELAATLAESFDGSTSKRDKMKRDKKKRSRSEYIDEGSSDGDDDFDVQMTAADLREEERMNRLLAAHPARGRHFFEEGEDELDEAEQARRIEERYRTQSLAEPGDDIVDLGAPGRSHSRHGHRMRFSSNLLPRNGDPKVFAVKCRNGMARLLVARILKKCFDYRQGYNFEQKRVDLGIISVFSVDHVKEYIYLESYRELFVSRAIEGLEGLFRFNISVVNPTELMQLMERQASTEKPIEIGSFVRMRKMPYRNDIALVQRVDDGGRIIICKLVPREDFVGKQFNKYVKNTLPQPQRFFNPALTLGATATRTEGQTMWGPLTFDKDGYLIVSCSPRMLIHGEKMSVPTADELALFYKADRAQITSALRRIGSESEVEFKLGDFVRAVGQLAGTIGKVTSVSLANKTASLLVSTSNGPITVCASLYDLHKYFPDGSHVVVNNENDPHNGHSGTTVKCFDDGSIAIISDLTGKRFVSRSNDCHITKLAVSTVGTVHRSGDWSLFDLVMLNDGVTVGCVVGIRDDQVIIMDKTNVGRQVPMSQIRQKIIGKRSAFDRLRNPCRRGDTVALEGSVQSVLQGTMADVEQLYNDLVFVRSNRVAQNSGLIAVPIKSVRVMCAKNKAKPSTEMRHVVNIEPITHPNRDPSSFAKGAFEADASAAWESAPLFEFDNETF